MVQGSRAGCGNKVSPGGEWIMKARAVAKYIKGSPQKARLVIDLIRGRGVNEALATLKTSRKRAAKPIEITLRSAIANAEQKADQLNVAIRFAAVASTKHSRR